MMRRWLTSSTAFFFLFSLPFLAHSQNSLPLTTQADPNARPRIISPVTQPVLSPGAIALMELEGRFAQDVAKGGGKAFATWFAEDAVTLNNGKPALLGHRAIAETAVWDPQTYKLTWAPQGAQMGPSGDTGFTWGHYDAQSVDRSGKPLTSSGRYITFWKKVADGSWKVALDASANDVPDSNDCCALPKP